MKKIDIKTDRLHLRIFTIKDITPKYVAALNDEEVIKLTESRYRKWNMASVKKYVGEKANKANESLMIGIFLKGGEHIGNIRLHSFSVYNKRVEVGILIWDRNEWGKGYATEALNAVSNYIFNILKLNKICAEYYSINKASAKMFKKLRFKTEGVFKNHFIINNKYIDAVRIAKFNLKD
ncbi:MAG: GNAT family N-acetyltransferase [Nanoarchaeota archaeon]|nr:GNAT family N-acetyltransferase [Nanoarchaeota archaeon]